MNATKIVSFEEAGIEFILGRTTYRTVCPACSDGRHKANDRCLAVNTDKGVAKCHHCGESYVVVGAGRDGYGTAAPKHWKRPEYEPAIEIDDPTQKAWAAIHRDRGIPEAVCRAARVEAKRVWMQPPAGKQQGREEWTYAAPYFREGEVINVKYRTKDKRFRLEKDAELCLYGLDDIQVGEPLVWVEGEWDKLSLAAADIWTCVSVPNGAPPPNATNYAHQFDFLAADEWVVSVASEHVIAVDNDAPGQRLRDELVRRLGPENCRVVVWPAGCKDANDVLLKFGADTLGRCIADARPVPIEGLIGIDELADRIDALYENGLQPGEHPGNDRLAEHYRVRPGEWTIVTGIPSHGKSAWLDWVLHNLAAGNDWRFAICSPENQPLERHAAALIQLHVNKPFADGPSQRMTPEELAMGRDWLADHVWFILPDDDLTIGGILARAKAAIYRHGVTGVVIDPWNEIEHQREAGMTETEYISLTLTKVRNFARRHKVHVWIVAHPTKLVKDKDGSYPVPTLYDISGAAHWRNKCDMGVVVWRDVNDSTQPTQVHVQKVRFRENGEIGCVQLFFDRATGRYTDLGPVERRYEVEWREPRRNADNDDTDDDDQLPLWG